MTALFREHLKFSFSSSCWNLLYSVGKITLFEYGSSRTLFSSTDLLFSVTAFVTRHAYICPALRPKTFTCQKYVDLNTVDERLIISGESSSLFLKRSSSISAASGHHKAKFTPSFSIVAPCSLQ